MKNVSKGHGAHCFCFASQHLVLKHTVRPCVAVQGLTGWSQLTPQCVGETARLFSYTEAPLWKAKKPRSHKPQGFLNKTSQSLLCNLFFLWWLEQKHTCKSVGQLVRIIARTCGFFSPCHNKTKSLWAISRRYIRRTHRGEILTVDTTIEAQLRCQQQKQQKFCVGNGFPINVSQCWSPSWVCRTWCSHKISLARVLCH